MDKDLQAAFNKSLGTKVGSNNELIPTAKPEPIGDAEGFVRSLFWSPLSLIGVEPPRDVEDWKNKNPGLSLTSDIVGYSVPYIGWARAAKGIPTIERGIQRVASAEKLAEAPFKAGFARELVRFTPFEIGRVAAAATIAEPLAEELGTTARDPLDVATQAAVDLGIAGGFGGIAGAFSAAGTRALKEKFELPGVDVSKPRQEQLRQLLDNISKGVVADKQAAEAGVERLRYLIRNENPRGKYVSELDFGTTLKLTSPKTGTREINRLFKEGRTENLIRSKIKQNDVFLTRDDVQNTLRRAGLEGEEAFIQYPRYIRADSPKTGQHIRNAIVRNLTPLDTNNGWFYGRDKENGLWVMARRLAKPEVGAVKVDEVASATGKPVPVHTSKFSNEWVVFKTDSPGRFVPEFDKFAKGAVRRAAIFDSDRPKLSPLGDGADVYDAGVRFAQNVPAIDARGLDPRKGNVAAMTEKVLEAAGAGKQGSAIAEGIGNFSRTYLAPGMFAFSDPLAARVFNGAKHILDTAEATAERLFLGIKGLSEKKGSLFREVLRGAKPIANDDNLQALIQAASKDPAQWEAVWKTIISNKGIDEAIKDFGLDGVGLKLLKALEAVDKWQIEGMKKTMKALGLPDFEALANHYMISRTWEGSWRIPIYDGNRMIGVVAGKQKGTAQARAQKILETEPRLRAGNPALAGELEQDIKFMRNISPEGAKLFGEVQERAFLSKAKPGKLQERQGVGGFIGELKPWTKDEFERLVLKQLRDYQRYQARLTTDHVFSKDLDHLSLHSPQIHEQLTHRVKSMFGEQGRISQEIDKAVDKVFAPVLGKNSATKIVSTANKWMFRWTLGFANAGYNIANMLTFVQTAMPQLAFLTSAAPARAAQYYTYFPILGNKVTPLGVLDVLKLTKKSFQVMRSPDDVLWKQFNRAARDGVWDPRFIEEYVGQSATKLASWRDVIKGDEPASKWLATAADALPSFSEKFARGHSFALGHVFFRDVMGVADEEMLYQLTKQFVEKTQFLYATGDRARIMTGPLGSAFGLFKNWVMHYISWMMEYTHEGMARGNWKPLLWMMGGTTAVGGVGALPFYTAADSVSQWMSNKSLMTNLYSMFSGDENKEVADAVFYGLPAFLGFSIQNQVSMPGQDPGKDAARLFSLVYLDRAKYLGKAVGQAFDHVEATGQSPVGDPNTRDLMIRALAPRMLHRVSQSVQGETIRTTSGTPVTTLSPAERLLFALGGNSINVETAYKVADELWDSQEKMKKAVAAYGEAWAGAMEARDSKAMRAILTRAIYEGVDVSSVIKSALARREKEAGAPLDQFSPQAVLEYKKAGLVGR